MSMVINLIIYSMNGSVTFMIQITDC